MGPDHIQGNKMTLTSQSTLKSRRLGPMACTEQSITDGDAACRAKRFGQQKLFKSGGNMSKVQVKCSFANRCSSCRRWNQGIVIWNFSSI